jgi:hypothetical protein
MKRISGALILITLAVLLTAPASFAASPLMPSLGSPVAVFTYHLSGTYSANKLGVVNMGLPYPVTVLYATAAAQAKSAGATPITLQLKNGSTEVSFVMDLSTPAAQTVVEATLLSTQNQLAKDAALSADLLVPAGSVSDVTVTIWVQRR